MSLSISEYFDYADSLSDNTQTLEVSEAVCQDMRRYSRKIYSEGEVLSYGNFSNEV
ncbi:MAG: hypothetical protein ACI4HL_00215 [Ruminococcus sp.]